MSSSNSELVIFLLGIVAALSTLHHYYAAEGEKRKSWLFISLLVLSIGTQLVTQALQYDNAVLTREEQDRATSDALYAFNQSTEDLLLRVANPRLADSNSFILGYWYFKQGYREDLNPLDDQAKKQANKYFDRAKTYLNLAINNRRFVPQSYYLLGTINRTTHEEDLSEAEKDYDLAIGADGKFGAAYYGRAILYHRANDLQNALGYLEKATQFSLISCWDLRDPDEQKKVWPKIKDWDRFRKMTDECGAQFDLLSPLRPTPIFTPAPTPGAAR
ncbi:MAG TPA: hypothetical protein VGJ33_15245 [Candidatus Angelobacter sp.]|jgi:tetratricopeptide (TPR) repeat protein